MDLGSVTTSLARTYNRPNTGKGSITPTEGVIHDEDKNREHAETEETGQDLLRRAGSSTVKNTEETGQDLLRKAESSTVKSNDPDPDVNNEERPRQEDVRTTGQDLELADQRLVQKLVVRDRQVRSHEAAHLAAAAGIAAGGASYTYRTGPDGKAYAVAGEVRIDTSPVAGDPQATLQKATQIQAAALAPAQPSAQDRAVASEAARIAARARAEITAARAAAVRQQQGAVGDNEKQTDSTRELYAVDAVGQKVNSAYGSISSLESGASTEYSAAVDVMV